MTVEQASDESPHALKQKGSRQSPQMCRELTHMGAKNRRDGSSHMRTKLFEMYTFGWLVNCALRALQERSGHQAPLGDAFGILVYALFGTKGLNCSSCMRLVR